MNEQTAPRYLFLSGFWLKVLAFLFMTIDHLGVFLTRVPGTYEVAGAFRIIGRLAFPLFVFLLAEGMRLSHRKGRYVLRILIAYLIITIPETFLVYIPALADLAQVSPTTLEAHPFTDILFLGLTLYCLTLKGPKKLLSLLPIGFILSSYFVGIFAPSTPYFPLYLRSGYGLYGLLLALLFFGVNLFLDKKRPDASRLERNFGNLLIPGVALIFAFLMGFILQNQFHLDWLLWESYAALSGLFLLFYSGKRGYDATWWRIFSYGYFLLHMAVLYLIFAFL